MDKYLVYFNFTQILCRMEATEVWTTNQFVVYSKHYILSKPDGTFDKGISGPRACLLSSKL